MKQLIIFLSLIGLTACGSLQTSLWGPDSDAQLEHQLANARTFAAQAKAYERTLTGPDQASAAQSYREAAKILVSTNRAQTAPNASKYYARSVISKIKAADGDQAFLEQVGQEWMTFLRGQSGYAPGTSEERVAMGLLRCRVGSDPIVGLPTHLDFTTLCR